MFNRDMGNPCWSRGEKIAVFNVSGAFYAIDDTCAHRGGPLGEGILQGNIVVCPWHQWSYDVTNGKSTSNPVAQVACYETKIEAGEIYIRRD